MRQAHYSKIQIFSQKFNFEYFMLKCNKYVIEFSFQNVDFTQNWIFGKGNASSILGLKFKIRQFCAKIESHSWFFTLKSTKYLNFLAKNLDFDPKLNIK